MIRWILSQIASEYKRVWKHFLAYNIFISKLSCNKNIWSNLICRIKFKRFIIYIPVSLVLAILPPGKFLPERSTPVYSPKEFFPPTLFRLVARFDRVRIQDSIRNRFTPTAYFAQSQTTLFPCILFMGGMFRGGHNRGGTYRWGIFRWSYLLVYESLIKEKHYPEINWAHFVSGIRKSDLHINFYLQIS